MDLPPLVAGIGVIIAAIILLIFRESIFQRMSSAAIKLQGELGRRIWEGQTSRIFVLVGVLWIAFGIIMVAAAF